MNPDKFALKKLEEQGIKFPDECPTNFYFYFSQKENAVCLIAELEIMDFEVEVMPAALGDQWLCLARKVMNADGDHLTSHSKLTKPIRQE